MGKLKCQFGYILCACFISLFSILAKHQRHLLSKAVALTVAFPAFGRTNFVRIKAHLVLGWIGTHLRVVAFYFLPISRVSPQNIYILLTITQHFFLAAISFWGDQHKQSAAAAAVVADIGNLLREKCQDARRSKERSLKKL